MEGRLTQLLRHASAAPAVLALSAVVVLAAACGGPEDDAAPVPADDEGADQVDDDGAGGVTAGGPSPAGGPTGAPSPPPAPGFDGQAVTVALVAPLAGEQASVTGAVVAGHHAYWRYVNERLGGVGARYAVEVRTVDTRAGAAAAYERVRDEVVLLAHVSGDVLNAGLRDRLERDGVVAVVGSRSARWSSDPRLLPIGVPEPRQIEFAERWLQQRGATAAAPCVVAASAELAEQIVDAATTSTCEALILRGELSDTGPVLEEAAAAGIEKEWILLADGWGAPLARGTVGRYARERIRVVQELTCAPGCEPDRGASGEELADPWFRYGWAEARVAHHVLEEALEQGGLDRSTVVAAATSIPGVDLDGVLPAWDYAARGAPTALAMFGVDDRSPGGLVLLE